MSAMIFLCYRHRTALLETSLLAFLISVTPILAGSFSPKSSDIGAVGLAGSSSVDASGTYTVTGAGADIYGTSDAFQYDYQSVTGDFTAICRLTKQTAAASLYAKAGLMVRNDLAAGSINAFVLFEPAPAVRFDWRPAAGAATSVSAISSTPVLPQWLKMQRIGTTLYAFQSVDGTTWTAVGTQTLPALNATVDVGLAVGGHSTTQTWTVTFDNVSLTLASTPQPPSAPSGLIGTPTDSQVTLSWTTQNIAGAVHYDVYRAGVKVGTTLTTSFTDIQLTAATSYSYTVQAVGSGGVVSAFSPALAVTTLPAYLVLPWQHADLGPVVLGGSTVFNSSLGQWTQSGAGADIGGTADAFQYAWEPLTGDGQVIARVISLTNTSATAKTGIMLRGDITPASPFLAITLTPGASGINLVYRLASGQAATVVSTGAAVTGQVWLRLVRAGATISAFYSTTGSSWTALGNSQTFTLGSTILAGLSTTSANVAQLATAQLDNVSIGPTNALAPSRPLALKVTGQSDTEIGLSWSAPSGTVAATGYNLYRNGVTIDSTTATSLVDMGLSPQTAYTYTVTVTATASGGYESFPSPAATTQTLATINLPTPWLQADVGLIGFVGSATSATGQAFTINGSGSDIWGTADAFHYVYQPITSDGVMITRVSSFSASPNPWSRGGLMYRESLDPGSRFIDLVATPGNGINLQWRSTPNGLAYGIQVPSLVAPQYLLMLRQGSLFTGYYSADGISWVLVGSQTIPMVASPILGGLPVVSHDNGRVVTVNLDQISLPSAIDPVGQLGYGWELQYFGKTGINSSALAPSGDGNTILQDYQAGRNPIQSVTVAPTFSLAAGTYGTARIIQVTAPTLGSTVYYTLDGTIPTTSSPSLPGAFGLVRIAKTQTLKAMAVHAGLGASMVTSATYTITTPGQVATGEFHTLVLRTDGTVGGTGNNSSGQLGGGTLATQNSTWVLAPTLSSMTSVAAGGLHSLGLKSDGSVWAWGTNAWGQIGDGTTTQVNTPEKLSSVSSIVSLSAGLSHSVALKNDGTVWVWGNNVWGQLGDGTTTQQNAPEQIVTDSAGHPFNSVIAVSAGDTHTLALKCDGTIWAWGNNAQGQLGTGSTSSEVRPRQVSGLSSMVAISAGQGYSLALRNDGTAWSWGTNTDGQLGNGMTVPALSAFSTSPAKIPSLTSITAIGASAAHALALTSTGTVMAWGDNVNGDLGTGTASASSTPATIPSLSSVAALPTGGLGSFSAVLLTGGSVQGWGYNYFGQLGDGTALNRNAPVSLSSLYSTIPVITSPPLADATVGAAFSYQITGTNTPVTFSASSLPAGLTMSATGLISGTPTTAGAYTISLSASRSGGSAGTASLVVRVNSSVYIALRTDGQPGSGIPSNPLDASTTAKLKAIMNAAAPYTSFYFGPGTYTIEPVNFVNGALTTGVATKPGWKFFGAGMGITTIQADFTTAPNGGTVFSSNPWLGGSDNAEYQNLSIDCHGSGLPAFSTAQVCAVSNFGTNFLADHVEYYGAYNDSPSDTYFFMVQRNMSADAFNYVVRNCYFHAPQKVRSNGSTYLLGLCSALVSAGNTVPSRLIENCTFDGMDAYGGIARGAIRPLDDGASFIIDLTFRNNLFKNCQQSFTCETLYAISPGWALVGNTMGVGQGSGASFDAPITDAIIYGNKIDASLSVFQTSSYTGGVVLTGLHDTNITVAGNQMVDRVSTGLDWLNVTVSATQIFSFGNAVYTNAFPAGMPSSSGTIRILDNYLQTSLTPGTPVPVSSSPLAAAGSTGQLFSFQLAATNSPTSLSVSAPGGAALPSWLSFNSLSGLLSGTPTAAGVYGLELLETNAGGTSTEPLEVTITKLMDTDGHGLPDYWQVKYFAKLGNSPTADPDGDGLTNLQEYQRGTDPTNADTDYDGIGDAQEIADGTNPIDPNSFTPTLLNHWSFASSTQLDDLGRVPLTVQGPHLLPTTLGGQALASDQSYNYATALIYRAAEVSGAGNINIRSGTIQFWYQPNWTSTSLGGTGPGGNGILAQVGRYTADGSFGNWMLFVDPVGNLLELDNEANTSFNFSPSTTIAWRSGEWHNIALTYSPGGVSIYLDGVLAGTSGPTPVYASLAARTAQGFSIGTNTSGGQPANGQIAQLSTYNYVLGAAQILAASKQATTNLSVTPVAGTYYSNSQTVTLASTTPGAKIYYTINGSLPTTSSAQYSAPLPVSGQETIRAVAMAPGYNTSVVQTQTYSILLPVDSDNNGLPDYWEMKYFGKLGNSATADPDGDGLTNLQEYKAGSDPTIADTDYDGVGDAQELVDGTNPTDPNSVKPVTLDHWNFASSTQLDDQKRVPLIAQNLHFIPNILGGQAIEFDSSLTPPSVLVYRAAEASGAANINVRNGSIEFWYQPNWTSTSLGGVGPNAVAVLAEVGRYLDDGSFGVWMLYIHPQGNALILATQANGQLAFNPYQTIAWKAGQWHHVALTYGPGGMGVYLDGQTAYSTLRPIPYYPSLSARTTSGFSLGTDPSGISPADGQLAQISTFNYILTPAQIAAAYQSAVPVITQPAAANTAAGQSFSLALSATNNPTAFTATGLPAGLSVNLSTGVISGAPTAVGTSTVTVTASSPFGTSAPISFPITVAPGGSISATLTPPSSVTPLIGQTITLQATAKDTAVGAVLADVQYFDNGSSIGDASQAPFSLNWIPSVAGPHKVTVIAKDSLGNVSTASPAVVFTVQPGSTNAPVITSSLTPTATAGQPFTYTVTGTNSPTQFSAEGLPSELSLTGATISGTLANGGSYSFLVGATNSAGANYQFVTLAVAPVAPVVSSGLVATGLTGQYFNYTISGTNAPTSFAATNLPPGLTLDPNLGAISGTPTTTGLYQVGISAQNAQGTGSATLAITISVGSAPLLTAGPVVNAVVNQPLVYQPVAVNNPGSFSLSGATGSLANNSGLPAGWVLNPATGAITATPQTVGNLNLTLTATNALGSSSIPVVIVVQAANAQVSTTVTFQSGVSPSPDYLTTSSGIFFNSTDQGNIGQLGQLLVGETNGGNYGGGNASNIYRSLLSFDVSQIPSGATITGANLTLIGYAYLSAPITVNLFQPGTPFSVSTAGWATNSTPTNLLLGSVTIPSNSDNDQSYTWSSQSNLTAAVQTAVLQSGPVQFLLISPDGEQNGANVTFRNESDVPASRPALTVSYTTAAPPLLVGNSAPITITSGSSFSFALPHLNGATSYSQFGLPSGLVLDSTAGVIKQVGSAAPGVYVATITAANSNGSSQGSYSFVVGSPPTISSALSAMGTPGNSFSFMAQTTNTPTAWSAQSLPIGLSIDEASGNISGVLDPSTVGQTFPVQLTASNQFGSGTATLMITVSHIPPVISGPLPTLNLSTLTPVYYQLGAYGSPTAYTLSSNLMALGLSIVGDSYGNAQIRGVPLSAGTFNGSVSASDSTGTGPSVPITVIVTPLPVPTITSSSQTVVSGQPFNASIYASVNVADYSSGVSPKNYAAIGLPAGLTIDPTSGVIRGTLAQAVTHTTTLPITLQADDAAGTGTGVLTLKVYPPGPGFSGLADITQPISGFYPVSIGAVAQDVTSASISPLPPGLTFTPSSSGGTIQGTPTTPGVFPLTVTATDAAGTSTDSFVLTIAGLTSPSTCTAQVGLPFSFAITDNTPTTSFQATGLPPELTLSATGVISGTPVAAATVPIAFTARDAGGYVSGTLVLQINPNPTDATASFQQGITPRLSYTTPCAIIQSDSSAAPVANQSFPVSQVLPVGKTTATLSSRALLSFDVSSLPFGAIITSAQLVLTPSNGSSVGAPMNIELLPSSGPFVPGSATWAANVGAGPALGNLLLDPHALGARVAYPFGAAFTSWIQQACNAARPLNLALASPDVEAGGAIDHVDFIINASNPAQNPQLLITYSISSQAPPTLTSPTTVSGTINQALQYQVTATGNPAQFAASGLPSGLTLNPSSGLISGIVAKVGSTTASIQAVNGHGSGAQPLTFNIDSATPATALKLISGGSQTCSPGSFLPQPITVQATQSGVPLPNSLVIFSIPTGQGNLASTNSGNSPQNIIYTTVTDANGTATVYDQSPPVPGIFSVLVQAGNAPPLSVTETAVVVGTSVAADPLVLLSVISGQSQTGPAGQSLALPVIVQATNAGGVALAGQTLTFSLIKGGGGIASATGNSYVKTLNVVTDGTGKATVYLEPTGATGSQIQVSCNSALNNSTAGVVIDAQVQSSAAPVITTAGGSTPIVDPDPNPSDKNGAFLVNVVGTDDYKAQFGDHLFSDNFKEFGYYSISAYIESYYPSHWLENPENHFDGLSTFLISEDQDVLYGIAKYGYKYLDPYDYRNVTLSWNDVGVQQYLVEKMDETGIWKTLVTTASTSTSDKNLLANVDYQYRVTPAGRPPSLIHYQVPVIATLAFKSSFPQYDDSQFSEGNAGFEEYSDSNAINGEVFPVNYKYILNPSKTSGSLTAYQILNGSIVGQDVISYSSGTEPAEVGTFQLPSSHPYGFAQFPYAHLSFGLNGSPNPPKAIQASVYKGSLGSFQGVLYYNAYNDQLKVFGPVHVTYHSSNFDLQDGYGNNVSSGTDVSDKYLSVVPNVVTAQEGDTFTVTFKNNIQSQDVVFTYHGFPSSNLSVPIEEASGSRYRKIALNGLPLSDEKPQRSGETDQEKEESYVDALTLGLRHSTTDIYLSIAASDLAISARRDTRSQVWNNRHGLRPHEEPNLPFGTCWSSNLAPSLVITSNDDPDNTTPPQVLVTDENGAVHTFIPWSSDGGATEQFFPMPTAKNEAQVPNLESLTFNKNSTPPTYVFSRKFGTTLTYGGTSVVQKISNDRVKGSKYSTTYVYSRLLQATDRLGNTINYQFQNSSDLIPSTITVANQPALKLSIQQSPISKLIPGSGNPQSVITAIWDANGNKVSYEYQPAPGDPTAVTLASVTMADGSVTQYGCDATTEPDLTPRSNDDPGSTYSYSDVSTITDPLGHSYHFFYALDHSRLSYMSVPQLYTGYFKQSGAPRNVSAIVLPDNTASHPDTTTFTNNSLVWLESSNGFATLAPGSNRQSVVTDATGFTRTYTFKQGSVVPLPTFPQKPGNTTDTKIVAYQGMTLDYGSLGSESFGFDLNASMALNRVTDFSGNTTQYAHTEAWSAPPMYRVPLGGATFNGFYGDPSSQTDALGQTKSYTYDSGSRIMTSSTDERGNMTWNDLDSLGRRITEKHYQGTSTSGSLLQETDFIYSSRAFPGFVTRKTIRSLSAAGDPSWTQSLVTQYVPDSNGRIAQQIIDPGGLNLSTSYSYDANGNKLSATDPRGLTTWFSYDSRNRLITVTYADGGQKQMVYDARGNKTIEYDENGLATLYQYDSLNRLLAQARDMNGNCILDPAVDLVTSFTYNNGNSKLSSTDPNGHTTSMVYDGMQRVTQSTDAIGNQTVWQYGSNSGGNAFDSSSFKPTHEVDARGFTTDVVYDALYRPTSKAVQFDTTAAPSTTKTAYDSVGNPVQVIDPVGNVTRTTFDGLNRLTLTTFADGSTTQYAYTSTGFKFKVVDPNGHIQLTQFNNAGWPTVLTQPAYNDGTTAVTARPAPVTQTLYDQDGNVAETLDPLGRHWDKVYDSRNRKLQEIGPSVLDALSGTTVRPIHNWRYDPAGRVVSDTDAKGNETDKVYDPAGRLTDVTSPAVPLAGKGAVRPNTHSTYDAVGNVLTVRDANGNITTNTYDSLNRLLTSTDAAKITVTNAYDAVGNKTAVTDGNQHTTTFAYDGLKRNIGITDPAQQTTSFTFDALNKIGRKDALGQVTTYQYDSRNRLSKQSYGSTNLSVNSPRNYAYDAVGNLLSVTESSKTAANVVYAYDALNRVWQETSGGLTHTYTLDSVGNRLTTTYGGTGRAISSSYDTLNRLVSMTETGHATTYAYDLNGNIVQKVLPNADNEASTFDALNRCLTLSTAHGANTIQSYSYGYDLVGNVTNLAEIYGNTALNRTLVNLYDTIYRLTSETATPSTGPPVVTTYTYDNGNNRLSRTITGGTSPSSESYTYNSLNQLTAAAGTVNASYTYDRNGNRITETSAGATDTYTYDIENRLVGLTKAIPGPNITLGSYTYAYDYRTRRILRDESHASGAASYLVFSGGTSVQEYSTAPTSSTPTPTPTVEYIRGSDYGGGIGGVLYTIRAGVDSFTHENKRGDVVSKTNASGTVTYQATYEAFGHRTQETGTTLDRQKANTKDEDPTGLLDEGMRYRDLDTGSFLTRDPLGFIDGPNMYTYVVSNPWTHFDPEGLQVAEADPDPDPDITEENREEAPLGVDGRPTPVIRSPSGDEKMDIDVRDAIEDFKEGGAKAAGNVLKAIRDLVNKLNPGSQSSKDTSDENGQKTVSSNSEPVKPGDTGSYGELKDRKAANGETEPLDMDHQPSMAAQIKAKEAELGRELTDDEKETVKKESPAVASPREIHRKTSPTYGGRNTDQKSTDDSTNLEQAKDRDKAAFDQAMKQRQDQKQMPSQ